MTSDIDGLVGWLSDPNALVKGEAHSGDYSLRVDPTHEFSPGYTAILGRLSETRVAKIKLEAWTYATDKNSKAKLEFVVKDPTTNQEILRDQTKLEEVKEFGKWVQITKEIAIPTTASYSSQVIIYVSRADATTPAYVDDLRLTALR